MFVDAFQDVKFASNLSGKFNNITIAHILKNKTNLLETSEYSGIKCIGYYIWGLLYSDLGGEGSGKVAWNSSEAIWAEF